MMPWSVDYSSRSLFASRKGSVSTVYSRDSPNLTLKSHEWQGAGRGSSWRMELSISGFTLSNSKDYSINGPLVSAGQAIENAELSGWATKSCLRQTLLRKHKDRDNNVIVEYELVGLGLFD